jgi:hypothetical protein
MGWFKRKKVEKPWRDDWTGLDIDTHSKWLAAITIGAYRWAALVMKNNGVGFENAVGKSIFCLNKDSAIIAVAEVEKLYKKKKETIV